MESTANRFIWTPGHKNGPKLHPKYKGWRTPLKTKQHNMTVQQETPSWWSPSARHVNPPPAPLPRGTHTSAQSHSLRTRHTRTISKTKESSSKRAEGLFLQLLQHRLSQEVCFPYSECLQFQSQPWEKLNLPTVCAAPVRTMLGQ